MKRKIYVASSWRNQYQPQIVELLRNEGHEVYDFRNPPNGSKGFAWSDIDENWMNWTTDEYAKALEHEIAIDGFNSDFDGMKWADTCVMILPCGRSANTEAGWMKGFGKEVFVFSPIKQEPELMYKIHDGIFEDIDKLFMALSPSPSPQGTGTGYTGQLIKELKTVRNYFGEHDMLFSEHMNYYTLGRAIDYLASLPSAAPQPSTEGVRLARFIMNNAAVDNRTRKIDERKEPYLGILGCEYCLRVINTISDGDNLEYLIIQLRPLGRDGETLFYRISLLYSNEIIQCDYDGNLINKQK